MIDTHCHLDMKAFDDDRDDVIKKAESAGVKHMLCVNSDITSIDKCIDIAMSKSCVSASVGIHPHEANKLSAEIWKKIEDVVHSVNKVVAIGETGLDYFKEYSSRSKQIEAFEKHIELAKTTGFPLIVHSRGAFDDTYSILKSGGADCETKVVIHCFSGNKNQAKRFLDEGYYLSFTGIVTFSGSHEVEESCRYVPLSMFMLETDAPFLSPVPCRGKRNEPSFLVYILRKVAEIKSIKEDDLERITTENAINFFQFPLEGGNGREKGEVGDIAYELGDKLYLNITNKCSNECVFCVSRCSDNFHGYRLRLKREPTEAEVISAVKRVPNIHLYKEIVFCGFGEPTERYHLMLDIARYLRKKGVRRIRLNTNGQGNLINGKNILPELSGILDAVSISMNAHTSELYMKICRPKLGVLAYQAMRDFIEDSRRYIPEVIVTVVNFPGVDVSECQKIVKSIPGAIFRVR